MDKKDKLIIKITLIVLLSSIILLFSYIQTSSTMDYYSGNPNLEWRLYKCVNGTIVNFTRQDILVCNGTNPFIADDEYWARYQIKINIFENDTKNY